MQIVIPMAGVGKRFQKAGYTTIKPLIEVHGKPMFEYVLNFFPGEHNFVFICNMETLANTQLRETLTHLEPKGKVVGITAASGEGGPVEGLLKAESAISNTEPVIVTYCDFNMEWDYADFKKTMEGTGVDSASVCYRGFHPHLLGPNFYAGVRTDEHGCALEVKEKFSFTKDKTQSWHQAGLFYFKTGALLKRYCRIARAEATPIKGEYYVSLLFNFLIRDGFTSLVYPIKYFCQWGTPEDLKEYLAWEAAVKHADTFESIADKQVIEEKIITASAPADLQRSFGYWKSYFS